MEIKHFWLIIEPFVYVNIKKNKVLLYNTITGKEILYKNDLDVLKIVKELLKVKNRMSIRISKKVLENNEMISDFISKIRCNFIGDIIEETLIPQKPFQFTPKIKILDKDANINSHKDIVHFGKELMLNLLEISLYINSQCMLNCSICDYAYKQLLFCCKSKKVQKSNELKLKEITNLIDETRGSALKRINILGGDIFLYKNFKQLVFFLNGIKVLKSYYTHYMNMQNQFDKLKLMTGRLSELNVLITFPIEESILNEIFIQIEKYEVKKKFTFVIKNNKDLETAERLVKNYDFDSSILPCYSGENLQFFRNNVFLKKKHVLEAKPSIKTILRRTELNPLLFGKLYILNNRRIHANINHKSLGKLGRDSLYDIVYNEMERGKSWRKLRKHVEPCRKCVYANVCPPLSNFELYFKKNNLCHIYR